MIIKPTIHLYFFRIVLLIASLLISIAALAQKKEISNNNEQSTYKNVTWCEGKNKHQLRIIPDQVAEFAKKGSVDKKAVKSSYPGSRIIKESPSLRIWKVNDESLKAELKDGKMPASLKKNHSPVFKDSSGRKRALPGNVIVIFDKGWSSSRVYDWADKKKLTIIKQISEFSNSYLIETPAGIESLDISNRLNNEPGVISATPNWWTEVRPR